MEERIDPMIPEITCIGKKQGLFICKNKDCKQPAVMCYNKNCQCKTAHKNCSNLQLDPIIDKLLSSKKRLSKDAQNFFNEKQKIIADLIEKLSDVREQIMKDRQAFGLKKSSQIFYLSINNKEFEKITGEIVHQSEQELKEKADPEIMSPAQLNVFLQPHFKNFWVICQQLKSLGNNLQIVQIKNESRITKDFKLLQTWIHPSVNKKIREFKLLYRASQNQFKVSKFHQKCDNINNTLLLCQTQFGNIIGGFNAYTWNAAKQINDPKNSCFIFSLSLRAKIPLCNLGNKAIICCPTDGPNFGSDNLTICDLADKKETVFCTNLGEIYNDGNYKKDQASYLKFLGTGKAQCKAKQWQIYQVI